MKILSVTFIFSLLARHTIGHPLDEFIPSNEWQFVPEDVAIPGGLEIRMDLDKGGRWARYPPGSKHSEPSENALVIQKDHGELASHSLAEIYLSESDLIKLEDKAYDTHFGSDIIRDYGVSLIKLYTSTSTLSDHAGRILGICLRNNVYAARSFIPMSSDVIPQLSTLEKRPVMILSALITTPDGFNAVRRYNVLPEVRRQLREKKSKINPSLSKAIVSLVENLAVYGESNDEICQWAAVCNKTSSLELKALARDINKKTGNFENVRC